MSIAKKLRSCETFAPFDDDLLASLASCGTIQRYQPDQEIFTQDKERVEYLRYFEYLTERGCLRPGIEQLDLDDLQGVHGLRALRAAIVLD